MNREELNTLNGTDEANGSHGTNGQKAGVLNELNGLNRLNEAREERPTGGEKPLAARAGLPGAPRVDGKLLLDELESVLRRFVVLPEFAPEALALWVVHTYAFELRDVSTYLGIESPEKRCGKTTLLGVLSKLVNRPVAAANISASAFFRVIEEMQPTLLIDEADTFLRGNEELRGILNAGYTRETAYVIRVANEARSSKFETRNKSEIRNSKFETRSKFEDQNSNSEGESEDRNAEDKKPLTPTLSPSDGEREKTCRHRFMGSKSERNFRGNLPLSDGEKVRSSPESEEARHGQPQLARFSCWCPKVMAAIGRLPETLADRCIVVRMQRKMMNEECERLRNLDTGDLRERCNRFVRENEKGIANARPGIPQGLHDRAADIWEPLLAIADAAGSAWPQKARQAAEGLTGNAQSRSEIGSLLFDIFCGFVIYKSEKVLSRDLVAWLNGREDRPWMDLPGLRCVEGGKRREVTEIWLSRQLRPYGVKPRNIRDKERVGKGYVQEEMLEVFRKYVPRSELEAFKAEVVADEAKGD